MLKGVRDGIRITLQFLCHFHETYSSADKDNHGLLVPEMTSLSDSNGLLKA